MIEELTKDYAAYAKVDLTDQMKNVHDSIEDMMTRLEEFESIIGMVQTEGAECMSGHIPKLLSIRPELRNLGKRIDALKFFVARANADVTALETAVDNAEAELGGPERIFGMLNPLSFFVSQLKLVKQKKNQEPIIVERSTSFEQPVIYKTDDYFEKQ